MTQEEIIEGNKLIAEFMNHRYDLESYAGTKGLFVMDNSFENISHKLNYNSSWDWLMPVVEKISQLDNFLYPHGQFKLLCDVKIDFGIKCITIKDIYGFSDKNIPQVLSIEYYKEDLIINVWLACVEFIKWYNENQKYDSKTEITER